MLGAAESDRNRRRNWLVPRTGRLSPFHVWRIDDVSGDHGYGLGVEGDAQRIGGGSWALNVVDMHCVGRLHREPWRYAIVTALRLWESPSLRF